MTRGLNLCDVHLSKLSTAEDAENMEEGLSGACE